MYIVQSCPWDGGLYSQSKDQYYLVYALKMFDLYDGSVYYFLGQINQVMGL